MVGGCAVGRAVQAELEFVVSFLWIAADKSVPVAPGRITTLGACRQGAPRGAAGLLAVGPVEFVAVELKELPVLAAPHDRLVQACIPICAVRTAGVDYIGGAVSLLAGKSEDAVVLLAVQTRLAGMQRGPRAIAAIPDALALGIGHIVVDDREVVGH